MASYNHARGRKADRAKKHSGAVFVPPRKLPSKPRVSLTPEEIEFIQNKISSGLTDLEVARMFFRTFNRDISPSAVKIRREP